MIYLYTLGSYIANNKDPDQTVLLGAVRTGPTMFASIMINSRRHIQDKNIGRIRVKILSLNTVIILDL